MRDFDAAGSGREVGLLGFPVLGNDRDARIELLSQHLKLEPRRRNFELHFHYQVVLRRYRLDELIERRVVRELVVLHLAFEGVDDVLRGYRLAVAPLGIRIQPDLERGEIGARVFHAVGEPGNVLVGKDAEIHQRLPHEDIAFLMGVAGNCPRVGHADRRRNAPTENEGLVARHLRERRGRDNFSWRGCILGEGSGGCKDGRKGQCRNSS